MNTLSSLDSAAFRLTSFYKANTIQQNESMVRISTGKKFSNPSNGNVDFFRARQFNYDLVGLDRVKRDLVQGSALVNYADEAASQVMADLTRMNNLVEQYYRTDRDSVGQEADKSEFAQIVNRISETIANATYDGRSVLTDLGGSSLRSIIVDARNIAATIEINYDSSDVVDASALTLGATDQATETAAVGKQLDAVYGYLAKTKVYADSLKSEFNLVQKKVSVYEANKGNIENIDEGAEVMNLTKRQMNQQMAVSMMAQANMFRSGIVAMLQKL